MGESHPRAEHRNFLLDLQARQRKRCRRIVGPRLHKLADEGHKSRAALSFANQLKK
jgi:hypothetical protein